MQACLVMEFSHTLILLQGVANEDLLSALFTHIIRKQNTSLYNLTSFVAEEVVSNFEIKQNRIEINRFDAARLTSAVRTQVQNVDQALFKALCVAEKYGHNPVLLLICHEVRQTDLLISATYLAEALGISINCVSLAEQNKQRQAIREISTITGGGYMEFDGMNHNMLYFVLEKRYRHGIQQDDISWLQCEKCHTEQLVGTLCNACGRVSCEKCASAASCCFCHAVWE